MAIMIVGLGNPGAEYKKTRHNAGFLALDKLAEEWGASWRMNTTAKAEVAEVIVGEMKIVLVKPQTFMNNSGLAVASLMHRYKITIERVWVVYDDAAIANDQVRVRRGGSAGGHNGLKSIIAQSGDPFARFRIGLGNPPERVPLEDFVLQNFSVTEMPLLENKLNVVIDLINEARVTGVQEKTVTIAT